MKGLIVNVYRAATSDCTNDGASHYREEFTLIGLDIPQIFEPTELRPAIIIEDGPFDTLRAIPADGGDGVGPMFGGNFIWTCDSRFPSGQPIKIFDRYETQKEYDRLSV